MVSVAVVIPLRNAVPLLADCMASIGEQTHAADEVWLVVGPSTDGTREAVEAFVEGAVRILDNPAGDRGSAINLALDASTADVIAMVDAQARLAPDYLERSLSVLQSTPAAVVGGPMRPLGRTPIGRAMALALQSPFGIGDSQFHFSGRARLVDSVYLGVYRAEVFAAVGRYNPALLRTEDDDLNWRARAAGYEIRLDPAICSTYLCRDSIGGIWRQYFGYSYWKVALATLRPGALRPRHLVPALFVLGLIAASVVSMTVWAPALVLLLIVYVAAAYVAASLVAGSVADRVLFPVAAATMHVAYGAGTWLGLASWSRLARRARRGAEAGSIGPAERS